MNNGNQHSGLHVKPSQVAYKNSLAITPDDVMQTKYDWLASADRDGRMGAVSVTNPRYLRRTAGVYSDNLDVDTKYVYLVDDDGVVDGGTVTYGTAWYGTALGDESGDSLTNAKTIDSFEAWQALADNSDDWEFYWLLTADIDAGGKELHGIGSQAITFTGTFDGGGNCLRNFRRTIGDSYNRVAVFNRPGATATIKHLTLINGTVIGITSNATQSYTSILAAEAGYGCLITRCRLVDCTVTQTHNQAGVPAYVGPLAGANHGVITHCEVVRGSARADILAGTTLHLGGLVGLQTGDPTSGIGRTEKCHSTAFVGSHKGVSAVVARVGGVVGSIWESEAGNHKLLSSGHDGDINYVTTANALVGGICGENGSGSDGNGGDLDECWHTGSLTVKVNSSTSRVGGLIGSCSGGSTMDLCFCNTAMDIDDGAGNLYAGGGIGAAVPTAAADNISNCYVLGSITDNGSTTIAFSIWGGFCGYGKNTVFDECYVAMGPWGGASANREGFIGLNTDCTLTDCYWDTDVAGHDTAADGTEMTTVESMAAATYSGFDFTAGSGWIIVEGMIRPRLPWQGCA